MKNLKMSLIYLILLSCLSACDSFVEVDLPNSQLTGVAVFENRTTANAAMVDIYSKLRDSGLITGHASGTGTTIGMYADELIYYGLGGDSSDHVFKNSLLATNPVVSEFWNKGYNQIYCANAIIVGVQNSKSLATADKDQFTGEGLFVRALVHFYLLNIYGDIPYVTTTEYEHNRLVSRMPVNEVYEHIISDLNQAIILLPEDYITAERVRPNKSTAYALLARVFLYTGKWAEAANAASAVLNNPAYIWENDLDKIFLKESTTTIWQFKPKLDGTNTDEAGVFIFISGPPPSVGLSTNLIASFENGDQRKEHWTTTVTNGTKTWYHSNKYKQNINTGVSVEYSILFRLAEQYLIRAEARAKQGDLIGAKEDLNKIRNTAGLENTTALSADKIVNAIMSERRSEFFTEYGHRFFDLKRTSTINTTLSASKPGWDAHDVLWPLPEAEILANPNLKPQNPGY